jgi:hypothetical protein
MMAEERQIKKYFGRCNDPTGVLSQQLPGGSEENNKKFNQDG